MQTRIFTAHMNYLRWLLLPFSLLYGLVVIIRNFFYDAGLFKSKNFNKPVICVGNIDVGGAGKSPMTEYLVRLLKDEFKIATLSRGYGRQTKGYQTATATATATDLGDEPAQFKHKFPDVTVAVCEKRADGLQKLLPEHDAVILDDAYQHRAVQAGLSILLFDYNRLNDPRLLLPAGNLREPFSGRWRANIIVVTKCPPGLTGEQRIAAVQRVEPLPYQKVFYSAIAYQGLTDLAGQEVKAIIDHETTVFLLTGIANPKPLLQHLNGITDHIIHHNYPDHHRFTPKNIAKLAAEFAACSAQKKLVVTTEKDAQRLDGSWFENTGAGGANIPVFVLPIRVEFLQERGTEFDQLITDYVREYSAYNSLH